MYPFEIGPLGKGVGSVEPQLVRLLLLSCFVVKNDRLIPAQYHKIGNAAGEYIR